MQQLAAQIQNDKTSDAFKYNFVQTLLAQIREPKAVPGWNWFYLWLHPSHRFIRLGGHQLIQTGASGETVFKWDNVSGTADETAASRHIGDVGELGVGNMKKPSQLIPVGGRLIQEDEELRVCQHEAGGIGTKQLFHVLRHARHKTIVFRIRFHIR